MVKWTFPCSESVHTLRYNEQIHLSSLQLIHCSNPDCEYSMELGHKLQRADYQVSLSAGMLIDV